MVRMGAGTCACCVMLPHVATCEAHSLEICLTGKVEVAVLTMIQTCDNSAGSADGQRADPFGTCDQDLFWDLRALPHSHSAGSLRSAHAGHAGHDSHFLFVWLPIRRQRAR